MVVTITAVFVNTVRSLYSLREKDNGNFVEVGVE